MVGFTFNADGQCTDFGGNFMNAGDSLGVDESVLNYGNCYLNFFFAEKDYWVFTSDGYSSKSTSFDSFKSILDLEESALWRENSNEVFVTCAAFAH